VSVVPTETITEDGRAETSAAACNISKRGRAAKLVPALTTGGNGPPPAECPSAQMLAMAGHNPWLAYGRKITTQLDDDPAAGNAPYRKRVGSARFPTLLGTDVRAAKCSAKFESPRVVAEFRTLPANGFGLMELK